MTDKDFNEIFDKLEEDVQTMVVNRSMTMLICGVVIGIVIGALFF